MWRAREGSQQSAHPSATNSLGPTDFQRTWCSLERALLFFETEKCTEPLGHIESGDLISLGVSKAQALTSPSPTERYPQLCPHPREPVGTQRAGLGIAPCLVHGLVCLWVQVLGRRLP